MFKKLIKFNAYFFAALAIRKLIKQLIIGQRYSQLAKKAMLENEQEMTFFKAFNELGLTDLEVIYALQKSEELNK
ncbi:type 1 periplasmic-binding domain-containing protein [Staphylococcus cohnii]|uniref:hypothetical protein n=1 Tax=Staphylococcus cohnii TaxID=29382 RepID=UPI00110711EE|nr:hypothetical protein [Staphylococcus cohnii]TLW35965.1 hypothetical protein FFX88_08690 [Staphylococcus cohnii]